MLRVNGFYGHVRRNDLRSLAMFAGFVVAFQIVAAVVLFLPLFVLDALHSPLFPLRYAGRYVLIVAVLSIAFFLLRFSQHVATVRANVDFIYVNRRPDPRLVNLVETLAISARLPAPKVGVIESSALEGGRALDARRVIELARKAARWTCGMFHPAVPTEFDAKRARLRPASGTRYSRQAGPCRRHCNVDCRRSRL